MFFLLCYGLCVHSSFNLKMCASLPLSFLVLSFSPSLLLSFSPSSLPRSLPTPPPPSPPPCATSCQQVQGAAGPRGETSDGAGTPGGPHHTRAVQVEEDAAGGAEGEGEGGGQDDERYVSTFNIYVEWFTLNGFLC